jgi:hypothetical protein
LCSLAGRLLKFPQLYAVIQSCRGKYFNNLQVFCSLSLLIRLLNFLSLMSYVGILHLSGENFRFLLFTVIPVSGVCILIVLCSVFLNWVCWARGNFSGEPGHGYIRVCESPLCGVPGRYEYIWALFGGVGGGTVRIFYFPWLCFGWYGTIEMVRGVLCFSFHFPQFVVSSLGGWICAVGILCYIFCGIL